MNFVEFVCYQQTNLQSTKYVEMLWSKIRESEPALQVTLEDEECYRNHIPIEFTKFLKKCVAKLREVKMKAVDVTWKDLDQKYLSTLIQFALEQENVTIDNGLHAANLFVLINVVHPTKRFFYKPTFVKVLEVLKEFNRSQDMTNTTIMFLMDDLKLFLLKVVLPEEVTVSTISVMHGYTYCCNDCFENISTDTSFENLGYIAFVNLKVLAEQLSKQKNNDKKLYPILISLTSSLKSSATNNLSRTVKVAHQKNVRLFIKQNFNVFRSQTFCLVSNMLKFVCLCSDFDEYDAIAQLIQMLPCETNQNLVTFFEKAMLCEREEFRKNLLNLVLPILRHPAEYETSSKRLVRAEILLYNVIVLLVEKQEDIRIQALKIISESSEDSLGRRVMRKIMAPENYDDINRDSIQDVLLKTVDQSWHKKAANVSYIQLMCNLLIIRKDLISVKALNRIRNISLTASPNDLKPCILHFKRLLENHSCEININMYILSIFVTQMFHPMATSTLFVKELHGLIFSNIIPNEDKNYIWHTINYLISYNFDVHAVFEKFHSLQLLREDTVRILMEYKIQEPSIRTPALKLLCIMLDFVPYKECHCLEEKLERSISNMPESLSPTDLSLVIHALTKILEKKGIRECSIEEITNYKRIQFLVCQAFFEQMFPVSCVKYITVLLSAYGRLIEEDIYWDTAACSHFEEDLSQKLTQVCNGSVKYHVYLLRDVVYIGELIMLRKATLTQTNFSLLKKIVTVAEHTTEFSQYLIHHPKIWGLCMLLYVKVCFLNSELIPECIENLEIMMATKDIDETLKLQIILTLFDVCQIHLQYYDPLVPHLFLALKSSNAHVRFNSIKLLIRLLNEDQLRLMDGQYLLFMAMLTDEKAIIAENVRIFVKETFIKKYPQTVARYFVSGVIHYNLYFSHPTISLSETDQRLLRRNIYSKRDRCEIYYYLYNFLPDNMKYNILNQLITEVLERIVKKTLPHSRTTFEILEDVLTIILYTVPKDKIKNVEVNAEYYDTAVKYIENNLLAPNLKGCESTSSMPYSVVIKNLLIVLSQLLCSYVTEDSKMLQNILFTITILTKTFTAVIKQLLFEESSLLRVMFKKLKKLYYGRKDDFLYYLLTVNPHKICTSVGRDDVEFYFQNVTDFTMISPYMFEEH